MGWGMAGNAPLKRWKQDTHAGGNTDPLILSWPARIKNACEVRAQYHHIIDIAPTILETAGLPTPTSVNGVKQMPLHGISMAYTFADAAVPTRKQVQYYEMLGSRAIWSEGWTAVTWHKKDTPWDQDQWELYHTEVDFSQSKNLASTQPEKLAGLKNLWFQEARKYNVLPLDDRRYERAADPTRPVAAATKPRYVYYSNTSIVHPLAAPQLLGRAHTITADATIPERGAEGVLACSGGEFGGWTLFVQDGYLRYTHNYLKIQEYDVSSKHPVPSGQHRLGVRFTPKEKSMKPVYVTGDITLLIDGEPAGELKDIKVAGQYSAVTGYGLLIGRNTGTPVSHRYKPPFTFTGDLKKVTIEIDQPSR
jgi:arylsulfatase